MGKTMKRRIFSGAVCEQLVYNVPDQVRDVKAYTPEKTSRIRFKDEADRARHREEISRRTFVRNVNENMRPGDFYITLTFSNEWEVHTFDDARRIRKNFIRSLLRACPDAIIFAVMGRGKGTQRIHFHLLTAGIPKDIISEKWKYGTVLQIKELRAHNWYDGVDYGQDYTGLANYLFDHWTEEQGGHRWYQTKNVRKPDAERPTEVRVTGGYSEKRPPVAPKGYMLVEVKTTKYGYLYCKYVVVPPKDPKRSAAKKHRSEKRQD